MTSLRGLRPPQQSEGELLEGVISRDVVDADELAFVTVESFSGELEFGPCPWMPRYDAQRKPHLGDACLLYVPASSAGDAWIVSWSAPVDDDAPSGGGGSAELPEAEVYDYFPDATLGALGLSDSDHEYHSTGTFPLTIQNSGGKKVLTHSASSGGGAGYAQLPLTEDARWAFARVRFQPGSTGGSTICIAFPKQSIELGGTPEIAPHAVFSPTGYWEAGVWEGTPTASYDLTGDSGALSGASANGFAPFDGVTECLLGFTVDEHGRMRMLLPNGDVVVTQDARYKTLCGPWAFIEIFVTDAATDVKPEIIEWQAGTTESEAAQWLMDRGQTAELVKKMLERYPTISLAVSYFQPLDSDLTAMANATPANGDMWRYEAGVWVPKTMADVKTALAIAAPDIGAGSVSNTEFGYLDGVTSAIQAQLNAKAGLAANTFTGVQGLAAGSAAAPILARSTDLDTGAYFPNTNEFGIAAGGSAAARFSLTALNISSTRELQANGGLFAKKHRSIEIPGNTENNIASNIDANAVALANSYSSSATALSGEDLSFLAGVTLPYAMYDADTGQHVVFTQANVVAGTATIVRDPWGLGSYALNAGTSAFVSWQSMPTGDKHFIMTTSGKLASLINGITDDLNVYTPPYASIGSWTAPGSSTQAMEYMCNVRNTGGHSVTFIEPFSGNVFAGGPVTPTFETTLEALVCSGAYFPVNVYKD